MSLEWEAIDCVERSVRGVRYDRARVHNGWLVRALWEGEISITFVPDPYSNWKV